MSTSAASPSTADQTASRRKQGSKRAHSEAEANDAEATNDDERKHEASEEADQEAHDEADEEEKAQPPKKRSRKHKSKKHRVRKNSDEEEEHAEEGTELVSLRTSADPEPCWMLTLLAADAGSQAALISALSLNDLAPLASVCQTWLGWLLHSSSTVARKRSLAPSAFPLFVACPWAKRMLRTLALLPESEEWSCQTDGDMDMPDYGMEEADRLEYLGWMAERRTLETTLKLLPTLPRLRDLDLNIRVTMLAPFIIRDLYSALGSRLLSFKVEVNYGDLLGHFIFDLGKLTALTSLHIVVGKNLHAADRVSFDRLTTMKSLSKFVYESLAQGDDFKAGPVQVRQLAACKHLTSLDVGSWNPLGDAESIHISTRGALIEDGIAALVRGRMPQVCPIATATLRKAGLPAPVCAPLQSLNLQTTVLSPEVWQWLYHLSSLKSLWPQCWSQRMTGKDFELLRAFNQLECLSIVPEGVEENQKSTTLVVDTFLPSLLTCRSLTSLQLGTGLELSASHLKSILGSLGELSDLTLYEVWVESVAPFAEAGSSLWSLSLTYCTDAAGGPPLFRVHLPPMPFLRTLSIDDTEDTRLTQTEAVELNAALRQRMPLLEELNENLRDDDDQEDGDQAQGEDDGAAEGQGQAESDESSDDSSQSDEEPENND